MGNQVDRPRISCPTFGPSTTLTAKSLDVAFPYSFPAISFTTHNIDDTWSSDIPNTETYHLPYMAPEAADNISATMDTELPHERVDTVESEYSAFSR